MCRSDRIRSHWSIGRYMSQQVLWDIYLPVHSLMYIPAMRASSLLSRGEKYLHSLVSNGPEIGMHAFEVLSDTVSLRDVCNKFGLRQVTLLPIVKFSRATFCEHLMLPRSFWQDIRSYNLGGMGCSANVPFPGRWSLSALSGYQL